MTTWKRFKIWDRWKAVSRVFGCTLIAMDSEASRLHAANTLKEPIQFKAGKSQFTVKYPEYVSTLQTPDLFCGMVLQAYCGLVEEHARDVLRELHQINVNVLPLLDTKYKTFDTRLEHYPPPNGIEDWGEKLLKIVNRSWSDVIPGKAKIVEAIVVRNALAHGTPEVTKRMVDRIKNAGGSLSWNEGSQILLSYDSVKTYRDHLRSFARVLSDATAEQINANRVAKAEAVTPRRKKRNRK